MTYLLSGAVGLILASAVVLVLGWAGSNATLIWASVLASVGAAVCLALAYYRSRSAPLGDARKNRS
ncbi:MAG: hypothetical protein ACR2KQ_04750 [Actinomycetota bacterium]